MKKDHTPGPWRIESEPFNIWSKTGALIANCNAPMEPDQAWVEGCANARLIAAAPDLLDALRGLVEAVGGLDGLGTIVAETDQARAVIARAEGFGPS